MSGLLMLLSALFPTSAMPSPVARAAERERSREQCRYAWNPRHRCQRRDGAAVRPGETCYLEASAQVYGRTA